MYKKKFNRDGAIFINFSFLVRGEGEFVDEWSVHPVKSAGVFRSNYMA